MLICAHMCSCVHMCAHLALYYFASDGALCGQIFFVNASHRISQNASAELVNAAHSAADKRESSESRRAVVIERCVRTNSVLYTIMFAYFLCAY